MANLANKSLVSRKLLGQILFLDPAALHNRCLRLTDCPMAVSLIFLMTQHRGGSNLARSIQYMG